MKKTYIVLFGLLVIIGLPQNLVAAAALEDVDKQEETWEQEQLAQRQQAARAVMQNLTPEQKKLGEQLLETVSNRNIEEIKKLILQGAPLNFQNENGKQTPLLQSIHCFWIHGTNEITHILVAAGADVNIADDKGYTPLIKACQYLSPKFSHIAIDSIKLLLRAGAKYSINQQTNNGITALIKAASSPEFHTVELLLQASAGASIDYQRINGYTALIEATLHNNHEAVKLLIFAGANLSIKNAYGNTALTTPIAVLANLEEEINARLTMTFFIEDALKEKERSPHVPTELKRQLPLLPTPLIDIILDYEQHPILRDQQRSAQKQTPIAENAGLRKTQCNKCSKCAIL